MSENLWLAAYTALLLGVSAGIYWLGWDAGYEVGRKEQHERQEAE